MGLLAAQVQGRHPAPGRRGVPLRAAVARKEATAFFFARRILHRQTVLVSQRRGVVRAKAQRPGFPGHEHGTAEPRLPLLYKALQD